MTATVADPLLRRLERRALGFCVVAAAAAWWARGGQGDVALGVLGGAVLIGVSYWAIRSSIDGILALALPGADSAGLKAGGSEEQGTAAGSETPSSSEPRISRPADQQPGSRPEDQPAGSAEEAPEPVVTPADQPLGAVPVESRSEPRVFRPADPAPRRGRALVYGLRFIGRYAVLGVLAYVMLVWLRLHPVGLIIGVSSIAVAAAWEAGSTLTRRG